MLTQTLPLSTQEKLSMTSTQSPTFQAWCQFNYSLKRVDSVKLLVLTTQLHFGTTTRVDNCVKLLELIAETREVVGMWLAWMA